MPNILIIGSLNADLVVRAPHFPQPGETISGDDLHIIPGGKGANQAVAAARQGASVAMLGRVGKDSFGEFLLDSLKSNQSVIAMDTPIVILDEPTTGQDAVNVARIAHVIAELRKEGKTVITITHDIDSVRKRSLRRRMLTRHS